MGRTTIQVRDETKAYLDTLPGKNYDDKINKLKEAKLEEEKRLIDATVSPIIAKIDLIK